jgi:glyceraldehyde 3-phosphate dehydrogenase
VRTIVGDPAGSNRYGEEANVRQVWHHDVQSVLRGYAKTLRDADAALFLNGAGEIGLSALKMALNAGMPVSGLHEPHPAATLRQIAARLGLGRTDDVDFDEATSTIRARGQTIPVLRELPTAPRSLESPSHERVVVLDCSGFQYTRARAEQLLAAGAGAVFFSGPGATPEERKQIPLLLHGVTLDEMSAETRIGSMGSCTTNSVVAPILALHRAFGVAGGLMMSVHSATNSDTACDTWASRGILDALGKPGGSGALKLVGLLVEELSDAFAGGAIRIPAADGSMTYLDLFLEDEGVDAAQVDEVLGDVARRSEFFGLNEAPDPLTISDVRETYYLAWLDPRQTRVVRVPGKGAMVQIASAYSNKWGFAAALLALPARWAAADAATD